METLASWKARLRTGTQIRLIWNVHNGKVNDAVFTVTKVQTNGVWGMKLGVERRLWMGFPKRTEIAFTEHGWFRLEGTQKIAEFVWVSEENETHHTQNTSTGQQKDYRTPGREDGRAYASDHLFLDNGQRQNAAEWQANAKRLCGQEWQDYCEGFTEGAEAEESARKNSGPASV